MLDAVGFSILDVSYRGDVYGEYTCIRRRESRVEMDDLSALVDQVSSAALVDAMGRLCGHLCHVLDLVSPTPDRRLFGPAITIGYVPYRSDLTEGGPYDFASLLHRAVENAPPDAVLVLASGGDPEVSLGGGTKFARVEAHGLAGVIADGRLRDFDELAAYSFATYCRGETPKAGGGRVMPFVAGVPVVFDRLTVVPGDYVYADRAGAVVIPAGDVHEVFEAASVIEAEDAELSKRLLTEHVEEALER
jgi:regulator of RNase E activity RraA